MSEPRLPRFDDGLFALDDALIDRLVDLGGDAASAPPPFVAGLIPVGRPGTRSEIAGEAAAREMFRAVRTSTPAGRRPTTARRLLRPRTLAAAAVLAVVSVTGAAASTGNLPGVAHSSAAALAKFAIIVPRRNARVAGPVGGGLPSSTPTGHPPSGRDSSHRR